jgi:hypothetical protein
MMTDREIHRLVEDYIGTDRGYLCGFTYSKHNNFYVQYCDMDVDVPSYRARGLTTRRAFIAILKDSKAREQARIIRGVFEMFPPPDEPTTDERERRKLDLHKQPLQVAVRLESDGLVETPKIAQTGDWSSRH